MTDLASLEPCDELLKPLRKIQHGDAEIEALEKRLSEYFVIAEGVLDDEEEEEDKEDSKSDISTKRKKEEEVELLLDKGAFSNEGIPDMQWDLYKRKKTPLSSQASSST